MPKGSRPHVFIMCIISLFGIGILSSGCATMYWGDDSWKKDFATGQSSFFGWQIKQDNDTIAYIFQKRLQTVAGFKYVSKGLPMRNSKGAIIYYLFFASQKQVAINIIRDIFNKHSQYSLGEY